MDYVGYLYGTNNNFDFLNIIFDLNGFKLLLAGFILF